MGAGGGDQQGAFGGELALHFAQVRIGLAQVQQAIGLEGADRCMAVEMGNQLQQMIDRDHRQPGSQRSLFGIGLWHHQRTSGGACRECRRQHALHRANGAGQGQFTQALQVFQREGRHLHAGGEDAEGNRQIEAPTVLGQVRRSEVERDAPSGKVEGRIEDRTAHPVLAFLHGGFGQADQGKGGQAVGHMGFNGNGGGFHAHLGASVDDGQGHVLSLNAKRICWGSARLVERRKGLWAFVCPDDSLSACKLSKQARVYTYGLTTLKVHCGQVSVFQWVVSG